MTTWLDILEELYKDSWNPELGRYRAPFAFRQQQVRAVTPEDYADRAAEFAGVQRAAGTLRWTGSWHTMFVSVDRMSGGLYIFELRL